MFFVLLRKIHTCIYLYRWLGRLTSYVADVAWELYKVSIRFSYWWYKNLVVCISPSSIAASFLLFLSLKIALRRMSWKKRFSPIDAVPIRTQSIFYGRMFPGFSYRVVVAVALHEFKLISQAPVMWLWEWAIVALNSHKKRGPDIP